MYEGSDYWRADEERIAEMQPQHVCSHQRVDSCADDTRTKQLWYCADCGCGMSRERLHDGSLVFYPK